MAAALQATEALYSYLSWDFAKNNSYLLENPAFQTQGFCNVCNRSAPIQTF